MNPMVNAGAIATTSLIPGDTAEEKLERIRDGLSRFAGRELSVNPDVYASEAASNLRNRGIAHLLESYGRLYFDAGVPYANLAHANLEQADLAGADLEQANLHRTARDGAILRGCNLKNVSETDPELAQAEDFDPKRVRG